MSRTYSSWRSLSSPNMPLQQHVGEPDDRVQRRPQLVRHRARNSDLCPQAISSSRAVWTFWIAIAPCAANVSTSSTVRSSNGSTVSRQSTITPEHALARRASARRASCGSRRARARASSCTAGRSGASRIWTVRRSAPTRPTSVPDPACDRHARDVVAVRLRRRRARPPRGRRRRRARRSARRRRGTAGRPAASTVSNTGSSSNAQRPSTSSTCAVGGLAFERLGEVALELGDALAVGHPALNLSHRPASIRRRLRAGLRDRRLLALTFAVQSIDGLVAGDRRSR